MLVASTRDLIPKGTKSFESVPFYVKWASVAHLLGTSRETPREHADKLERAGVITRLPDGGMRLVLPHRWPELRRSHVLRPSAPSPRAAPPELAPGETHARRDLERDEIDPGPEPQIYDEQWEPTPW